MDNPETLTSLGTQDTGQINVRENRRANKEWTIQRHLLHWEHKTQDKYTLEKTKAATKNVQSRDTGNIGNTRHRTNKR